MLAQEDLMARISAEGFCCQQRPDADFFDPFTSTYLVECAELRTDSHGTAYAGGVSFSVQFGEGLAFLGMPGGVMYQIFEPVEMLEFCMRILRGGVVPLGVTPYSLPQDFITEFRMREVWPIECVKPGVGEIRRLSEIPVVEPPFTEAEFVSLMAPSSVSVTGDGRGRLHLALRSAEALAAFDASQSKHKGQRILIYDGLRHSGDHIGLLRLLCELPAVWIFDVSWGTRVDPNDPYYSSIRGTGPSEPMSVREVREKYLSRRQGRGSLPD